MLGTAPAPAPWRRLTVWAARGLREVGFYLASELLAEGVGPLAGKQILFSPTGQTLVVATSSEDKVYGCPP